MYSLIPLCTATVPIRLYPFFLEVERYTSYPLSPPVVAFQVNWIVPSDADAAFSIAGARRVGVAVRRLESNPSTTFFFEFFVYGTTLKVYFAPGVRFFTV